ncbi:MAG: HAMP domain-containing protein [Bacteroidetes bacterium]|nr:HAMP domain-containing protein [Bacteroidota bacterium]
MAKTRIQELISARSGKAATYAGLLLLICLGGASVAILLGKPKAVNPKALTLVAQVQVNTRLLEEQVRAVKGGSLLRNDQGQTLAAAAALRIVNSSRELGEQPDLNAGTLLETAQLLEKHAQSLEKAVKDNEAMLFGDKRLAKVEQEQRAEALKNIQETAQKMESLIPKLDETSTELLSQAEKDAAKTSPLPWVILGVVTLLSIFLVVKVRQNGSSVPAIIENNVFEPLKEIKKATKDIVKNGKLERPIDYDEKDEVGDLVKNFNEMAIVVGNTLQKLWDQEESNRESNRNLRRQEEKLWGTVKELKQTQAEMKAAEEKLLYANKQLEYVNNNLDKLVKDRTEALQEALEELKGTQNKMILSEKMAVLGQLVAGVAHEINSPLGAIKSSMTNIKDSLPDLIGKLPAIVAGMSPEQKACWQKLQEVLKNAHVEHLSLKEQRELRKQFETLLEDEDIDEAEDVSRNLIDAGIRGNLQDYLPLFRGTDAYEMSRLIYQMGAVYGNTRNVELAINKTNKIVFTLKNYSRRQDEDVLLPIQLQENLETILVLYHNQLKHGIDLHTDFAPVNTVLGNADEIGQVWTNIITNAIQAMGGKGKLEIRLWQEGDYARVSLKDHGPGIPEEIREKIFEPFFTTKKKGEGTGLGLDICKKIIEKHGGTLQLFSEMGVGSEFRISLPIDKNGKLGVTSEEQVVAAE